MTERQYVQPAPNTDLGFYGTASAEEDIVAKQTLYDVTGVDRSEWTILGLDVIASRRWPDAVHVHAVNRKHGGSYDELRELTDRENGLPVTTFIVEGLSERDVISCMKSYSVYLRSPNFPKLYEVDRVETVKPQ